MPLFSYGYFPKTPSSVTTVLPAPGPRCLCPGRRWPHPAPPERTVWVSSMSSSLLLCSTKLQQDAAWFEVSSQCSLPNAAVSALW